MVIHHIKRLFSKKHMKGCRCRECMPCMPKKRKAVKKKAVKKKKRKR